MGGVGAIFGSFAVDVQKGIVAVRIFLVGARAVVVPFVGMCLACGGASSLEGPSASFADGQVVVATWVGTVDHSVTGAVAAVAGRHDGGVDLVDGHRDAVVKDVAFAFKIFPTYFHAVLDDAPMKLVHIFKSLFQQVGRSFFALDSSGAVGEYFFVFEVG